MAAHSHNCLSAVWADLVENHYREMPTCQRRDELVYQPRQQWLQANGKMNGRQRIACLCANTEQGRERGGYLRADAI